LPRLKKNNAPTPTNKPKTTVSVFDLTSLE